MVRGIYTGFTEGLGRFCKEFSPHADYTSGGGGIENAMWSKGIHVWV